jgi:uncharacterized protein YjbI with pentapeptide repeats
VTADGQTCTTTVATGCTVTGLKNGRSHTIRVRASNVVGLGKAAKVQVTSSNAQNCTYFGPDANLQDCDLAGANLAGANLTDANLTGTDLNGTNLTGADLTGVSSGGITGFPSALPSGWLLVGNGYLVGPGANLTDANLNDATLYSADLAGTNLTGASLDYVVSGRITGTPSALPSGWLLVNGYLVGPLADLYYAALINADLANADLTSANLTGANLFGANLTGANLDANLTGVSSGGITGTPSSLPEYWSLVGGYLVGPEDDLAGAGLSNVDLTGVDLSDSNMDEADLHGANLTGANLFGDNLENADLTSANLTGTDLNGTDLTGANLTGAIWSNTTCPDGTNSNNDGGTCVNNVG